MTENPLSIVVLGAICLGLVVAIPSLEDAGLEFVLWLAALIAGGLAIAGAARRAGTGARASTRPEAAGEVKEGGPRPTQPSRLLRSGGLALFQSADVDTVSLAPPKPRGRGLALLRTGGVSVFVADTLDPDAQTDKRTH